jgi:tape measure domain-containing protein
MAVSQELVAKFKADTSDFNSKLQGVKKEIDSVGSSAKKMSNDIDVSANQASASFNVMSSKINNVVAVIGTASVAVGAFSVKVGSDMESAIKRTEAMLGSVKDADFVFNQLRDTAYETGTSIISLSESYGKLATFVENGSLTLQESIDLQNGLTSTAMALGASSEQLSTVMYGLSQAMGSGVVRAEEFNQVTEPLPGLINRIEEATGLASGELRGMVNDGLITSEMFKNMLIPALSSFEKQAVDMKDTLKVQAGIMANTATALGEDIYDGIAPSLTSLIGLVNEFAQRFVSIQRASKQELNRRLTEFPEKQRIILSASGQSGRNKKADLLRLFKEEAEITSALYPSSYSESKASATEKPVAFDEELRKLQEEYRKKLAKGIGGGGGGTRTRRTYGGSSSMKKAEAIKAKEEAPLFKEDIQDYRKELGNFSMETVKEFDFIESMFGDMKDSIISGFVTMSSSGKTSFKDMARSIIGDIQSIITRVLIMKAISGIGSAISGYFAPAGSVVSSGGGGSFGSYGDSGFILSGARASGGSVGANKSYLVGERGAEILTMGNTAGHVTSNDKAFGGSTVFNIDARGAEAGVENKIKRVMMEVLNLKKQVPNIAISAVREQNSRKSGFLS